MKYAANNTRESITRDLFTLLSGKEYLKDKAVRPIAIDSLLPVTMSCRLSKIKMGAQPRSRSNSPTKVHCRIHILSRQERKCQMENNYTSITLPRYEDLVIAEAMLDSLRRLYETERFPDGNTIRAMMGWKKPEDKELHIPDVSSHGKGQA